MTSMEKAVWGTAFALASSASGDESIALADQAISRLREASIVRSGRLKPEEEAARSNVEIDRKSFDTWYTVSLLVRHGIGRQFPAPTEFELDQAYERYQRSRLDFY